MLTIVPNNANLLSVDLLVTIFQFLRSRDLYLCSNTCKVWKTILEAEPWPTVGNILVPLDFV